MDRASVITGFIAAHPAASHLNLRHIAHLSASENTTLRREQDLELLRLMGPQVSIRDLARGVAARQGGSPVHDLDFTHWQGLGTSQIQDVCDLFAHLKQVLRLL